MVSSLIFVLHDTVDKSGEDQLDLLSTLASVASSTNYVVGVVPNRYSFKKSAKVFPR